MARQEARRKAWTVLLIGAGIGFLGGDLVQARAAEKETRIFNVKIDGTPAGDYKVEINSPDGRTFTMMARADVSVSRLLIKVFSYSYQGKEVWEAGRLVQLQSECNDDGKQFKVLVQAEGGSLRIRVNGTERTTRPDVWTTTYWRLPELQASNQPVTLLDCDRGEVLRGTLRYIRSEQLSVAGQTQDCAHYQLLGEKGLQVDLWYDAQKRLVRQHTLDDGHHVVLELTRIQR